MNRIEEMRRALSPNDLTKPPPEGTTPEYVNPKKSDGSGGENKNGPNDESTPQGGGEKSTDQPNPTDNAEEGVRGSDDIDLADGLDETTTTIDLDSISGLIPEPIVDAITATREAIESIPGFFSDLMDPLNWLQWIAMSPIKLFQSLSWNQILGLYSMVVVARAHKKQGEIMFPGSKTIDDFWRGFVKQFIQYSAAWGISREFAKSLAPGLWDAGLSTIPLLAILHTRSNLKRIRNIENTGLTQDELDVLFANPDNKAKLDHLWRRFQETKRPGIDNDLAFKAHEELLGIPGYGNGRIEFDPKEPLEIQERTRLSLRKIGSALIGKMPKMPEDLAVDADEEHQKQALFNTFIRHITATNPRRKHTKYGLHMMMRTPEEGYYDPHTAAQEILQSIKTRQYTDTSELFDEGHSSYWQKKQAIITDLCNNQDINKAIKDEIKRLLYVDEASPDQTTIDKRAEFIFAKRSSGKKRSFPKFWKKESIPYEFDDVNNIILSRFLDSKETEKILEELSETDRKTVLDEIGRKFAEEIENAQRLLDDKTAQNMHVPTPRTRAKELNARIGGEQSSGWQRFSHLLDGLLQFLPFVPESWRNLGNIIFAWFNFKSYQDVSERVDELERSTGHRFRS